MIIIIIINVKHLIIIIKKPIYNLFQLKQKKTKCSCEEIEKKKQVALSLKKGEIQSFKIRSP